MAAPEIDSNFSKAHRIVTTSILPLVEQYGEHSRSVWEATKFWKQFFEASANVSLSGYEELAGAGDGPEGTSGTIDQDNDVTATAHSAANSSVIGTGAADDTTSSTSPVHQDDTATARQHQKTTGTSSGGGRADNDNNTSLLDDGDSLAGSTPRHRAHHQMSGHFASPNETMRREIASAAQRTPGSSTSLAARLAARGVTLGSTGLSGGKKHQDPLLHRVLDKTYRVGQTPIRGTTVAGGSPARRAQGGTGAGKDDRSPTRSTRPLWADSPGMSSPLIPAPQLRSAAFLSPIRPTAATTAPRTPGVSVQATPLNLAKRWPLTSETAGGGTGKGKEKEQGPQEANVGAGVRPSAKAYRDEIHWESDSDDDVDFAAGMSPPKTIQFALPPSKLLQTPGENALIHAIHSEPMFRRQSVRLFDQ